MAKTSRPNLGGFSLGTGIPTLLVIFITLCLTTFACLAAVSAAADHRLAQKTAQTVTRYYEGEGAAQEALAQLAQALAEPGGTSPQALGWQTAPGGTLTRTFPLGETQALAVEVDISSGFPQILRWRVENTQPWQDETTFELWDGPIIA